MGLRIFAAFLAVICSGAAVADSLDINLNDDSLEGVYTTNWRTADASVGLLYNDEQEDWVASAGLLAMGERQSANRVFQGGLGGKLYVASVSNEDIIALGLGGQVRVYPGNGPIAISGSLFYAPDIVTMLDGEEFWEASVRAEFEMVKRRASFYIGYREIQADLDNGRDVTVDNGLHAGVKIVF